MQRAVCDSCQRNLDDETYFVCSAYNKTKRSDMTAAFFSGAVDLCEACFASVKAVFDPGQAQIVATPRPTAEDMIRMVNQTIKALQYEADDVDGDWGYEIVGDLLQCWPGLVREE